MEKILYTPEGQQEYSDQMDEQISDYVASESNSNDQWIGTV